MEGDMRQGRLVRSWILKGKLDLDFQGRLISSRILQGRLVGCCSSASSSVALAIDCCHVRK